MFGVALDRYDVDGFWLVSMHVDHKPEVGRQVAADFVPRVAGVVAAHDIPVFLHEKHPGTRRVHRDAVNTMANLGRWVGHEFGPQSTVDRPPRLAAVIGPKSARGGDCDEDPLGIAGIEQDRVQAHPAGARLPARP